MRKCIIQTDDKTAMLSALQSALTEGEKFAKSCFDALVKNWGADKCKIDQVALIEMATGHWISCQTKGVDLGDPAEYIKDGLEGLSDYGLSKMGLTRKCYQERIK